MIEHWLEKDGLAAVSKMGWPEWDSRRAHDIVLKRLKLSRNASNQWWAAVDAYGHEEATEREHTVALALLRDFGREWLERSDAIVPTMYEGNDFYIVWGELHRDFDEALIAAILSVEETT